MPGYPYPIRLKAPKARKIKRPWITTPWGLVPLSLAAIGAVAHFLGPVHPTVVGAALVLPGAASRLAAEHRRRQTTTAALAFIAILIAHPVVAALAAGWAALQWVEPHERTRQRRRLAAIKAAWPHMATTAGVDGSAARWCRRNVQRLAAAHQHSAWYPRRNDRSERTATRRSDRPRRHTRHPYER